MKKQNYIFTGLSTLIIFGTFTCLQAQTEIGFEIDPERTAVVITDPQNDFLSEKGVTWGLVGNSVKENQTVEHIEALFVAAKENGYDVFVSPHYYFPTDKGWQFGGTVETMMHDINMFGREGALDLNTPINLRTDARTKMKAMRKRPARSR